MAWRVVVVDDEAQIRSLVVRLLCCESDFVVVGEAEDGLGGIEVADREQPDLVLLDCHMPGADGLAALPEIRRRVPGAVIVMVSGSPQRDIRGAAIAAGADGFYAKTPKLAARLAEDLRDLLNANSGR